MSQPVVVSNSSPIIAFERLEQLELLRQLIQTLHIPSAVRQEVFGVRILPPWIVERPISHPTARLALAPRLGAGESEAILLALELAPCYLLMDDLAARRAAQSMNIPVIGTVGLLLLARQRNLLAAVKPHLDTLRQAEFRISEIIYHLALQQVGEDE
jgi:predicted nucleic acid-binding protein